MASSDVLKMLFNNGVHFADGIPLRPTGPAVSCWFAYSTNKSTSNYGHRW